MTWWRWALVALLGCLLLVDAYESHIYSVTEPEHVSEIAPPGTLVIGLSMIEHEKEDLRIQATEFCAITGKLPPPNDYMKQEFTKHPREWADLLEWLNHVAGEIEKHGCNDA